MWVHGRIASLPSCPSLVLGGLVGVGGLCCLRLTAAGSAQAAEAAQQCRMMATPRTSCVQGSSNICSVLVAGVLGCVLEEHCPEQPAMGRCHSHTVGGLTAVPAHRVCTCSGSTDMWRRDFKYDDAFLMLGLLTRFCCTCHVRRHTMESLAGADRRGSVLTP